jgi:hypothetical protein
VGESEARGNIPLKKDQEKSPAYAAGLKSFNREISMKEGDLS